MRIALEDGNREINMQGEMTGVKGREMNVQREHGIVCCTPIERFPKYTLR